MAKSYLAVAAIAGLLLGLGAPANAGGRTFGSVFTPPGWSHNTTGQRHANWGSNTATATGTQPPGWTHNTTGQTNGWNSSLVAPGLNR